MHNLYHLRPRTTLSLFSRRHFLFCVACTWCCLYAHSSTIQNILFRVTGHLTVRDSRRKNSFFRWACWVFNSPITIWPGGKTNYSPWISNPSPLDWRQLWMINFHVSIVHFFSYRFFNPCVWTASYIFWSGAQILMTASEIAAQINATQAE